MRMREDLTEWACKAMTIRVPCGMATNNTPLGFPLQFRPSLDPDLTYQEPPMLKSKEVLLLQDVWRQAYRKGSLDVEFSTKSGAVRARLQLYNAVRKQKAGEDAEDIELVHAAEQLEIVWVGGPESTTIRLQKRADNDMMAGITKALGRSLDEYQDPEMLESSKRLLDELGAEGGAPATNKPMLSPATATASATATVPALSMSPTNPAGESQAGPPAQAPTPSADAEAAASLSAAARAEGLAPEHQDNPFYGKR